MSLAIVAVAMAVKDVGLLPVGVAVSAGIAVVAAGLAQVSAGYENECLSETTYTFLGVSVSWPSYPIHLFRSIAET